MGVQMVGGLVFDVLVVVSSVFRRCILVVLLELLLLKFSPTAR